MTHDAPFSFHFRCVPEITSGRPLVRLFFVLMKPGMYPRCEFQVSCWIPERNCSVLGQYGGALQCPGCRILPGEAGAIPTRGGWGRRAGWRSAAPPGPEAGRPARPSLPVLHLLCGGRSHPAWQRPLETRGSRGQAGRAPWAGKPKQERKGRKARRDASVTRQKRVF